MKKVKVFVYKQGELVIFGLENFTSFFFKNRGEILIWKEMMFEKLHNFSQSNSNIFRRLVLIKLLLTTDNLVKVDVGCGEY